MHSIILRNFLLFLVVLNLLKNRVAHSW